METTNGKRRYIVVFNCVTGTYTVRDLHTDTAAKRYLSTREAAEQWIAEHRTEV